MAASKPLGSNSSLTMAPSPILDDGECKPETKHPIKHNKTRRGGIKHKYNKEKTFSIVSNNVAGISKNIGDSPIFLEILKKIGEFFGECQKNWRSFLRIF